MLDQDADEALERADDRPVQHHRRAAGVVFGDVLGAEAPRHAEVDLHRAALPRAADAVLEVVLDLRAVEGALAGQHVELHARALECLDQRPFGLVPALVRADALHRPRRDLVDDVGEAEVAIYLLQQRRVGDAFRQDVILGAEDVAVVLGEAAHAHQAVQRSRGLVAVAGAELAVAQRQFAVAAHALVVDEDVSRAVHRLDRVVAVLR